VAAVKNRAAKNWRFIIWLLEGING